MYMEENSSVESEKREKRWCILRHADADLIGDIFSGKRKVYNAVEDDSYPLPPFEYYIPFEDLKNKPLKTKSSSDDEYQAYDALLDERALRNDLHHFIFVCQPKEVVREILFAPWIRTLRNRLYAYRDNNGDPVEISNTEMERFKTVIKRYDFQIFNGEPVGGDVKEGDKVEIVGGPMAGSDGKVISIRERDGQVTLTVEFSMFQDKMHIAVPGISIADVRLLDDNAQQLLQDPIIGHFEDEMIELLCHLHGKKGSTALNREDRRQLKFLAQYQDIVFEDSDENRAKFAALMLICAYLMNDKKAVKWRYKQVEDMTGGRQEPSSELDCYLMTALFIVGHNPVLRKKTKTWRQNHPECSLAIRRLQSIAKQIRC